MVVGSWPTDKRRDPALPAARAAGSRSCSPIPAGRSSRNRDEGHWTIPKGEADARRGAPRRRPARVRGGDRPPPRRDGDADRARQHRPEGRQGRPRLGARGRPRPGDARSATRSRWTGRRGSAGARRSRRSTGSSGSTPTRRGAGVKPTQIPLIDRLVEHAPIVDSFCHGVSGYVSSAHADLRRAERQRPRPARALARRRPALPRAPPPPRAAAVAAGRAGERHGRLRPARARSSSTRSRSPAGTTTSSCSPGSPATAASGPTRCSTRSARLFETYNKGLSIVPTAELPWYRITWDRDADPARGRHVRRARGARRGAPRRGSATERADVVDRRRAARGDRLVLAADEPGPGDPRGARRGGHPRPRPARRQPPRLRPRRAAVPGGAARASGSGPRSSSATSCCRATAPTGCSGDSGSVELWLGRTSRASSASRTACRSGRPAGSALLDGARRGRRRCCRSRSRAPRAAASSSPARRASLRAGASAEVAAGAPPGGARAGVAFLGAARPARLGPRRSCGRSTTSTTSGRSTSRRAKRRWGYYVLPILFGDRLVGRIEPRIERKADTLRIVGLWWEDGFDPLADEAFVEAFAEAHRRASGVRRRRQGGVAADGAGCGRSVARSSGSRRRAEAPSAEPDGRAVSARSDAERSRQRRRTVDQAPQLPALSRAAIRNS